MTGVDAHHPWVCAGLLFDVVMPLAHVLLALKSLREAANETVKECMKQLQSSSLAAHSVAMRLAFRTLREPPSTKCWHHALVILVSPGCITCV